MASEIKMPALSPTMESGTLSKWLVAEGDQVRSGDIIAEIETDKTTMEVETIEDGIIGKLLVTEGAENVQVNATIAILIDDAGDTIPEVAATDPAWSNSATKFGSVANQPAATAPVVQPTVTGEHWINIANGAQKHYAMRWRKKCGAMTVFLLWAKKLPNIKVPIK